MATLRAWFGKASPTGLFILALLVGLCGAFGAALFHFLIRAFTLLFFGTSGGNGFIAHLSELPSWQRVLIPTIGGLLVGITFALVRVTEAEGEGVPEVMEALALRRGKIRPWVAPVKIFTAALTLGSGGSAGREGPIIQIGSAIGSSIGQFFKLDTERTRLLLAAGAAAGIGGTFGAPVAGVVFSVELLLKRASIFYTFILSISALTGHTVASLLIGHNGLRFSTDIVASIDMITLAAAFLLGVISALTALIFGTILRVSTATFKRVKLPRLLRPALGGFCIGLIGLTLPYIHEPAAYPLMVDILSLTALPFGFLATLLLVKMLATGITLGSGGSGGIFAPSLLIGTILGSVFGSVLFTLGILAPSDIPTFALAGMAAVFAGAAHAPLTAIFILYEMTSGELALVPFIAIASLTAFILAKKICKTSVYTERSGDV